MWADEDRVPNKRTALIAAVNAHDAEVKRQLASGSLSKAQADELTAEAAALVEGAEDGAAGDGPAAEAGGEAAEPQEATPMADNKQELEKALDPKAVGASIAKYVATINKLGEMMGWEDDDKIAVPDGEATVETVEKSLQDFEAGLDTLSKGFSAVMSLTGGSKAKAEADVREREKGKTPHGGPPSPGRMSKEQLAELVTDLEAQGYVLQKADAPAEDPPPVDPAPADAEPTSEIDRAVKALANEDLIKAAVAKMDVEERERLNKALALQSAPPPDEATDPVAELGESNESSADFYAAFARKKMAADAAVTQ